MNLRDLYKKTDLNISFEVFPPSETEKYPDLLKELDILKQYNPAFVSLTWGASGSNNNSVQLIENIKNKGFDIMPHFTCVCSTKKFVENHLSVLKSFGIDKILALRGDFPEDKSRICNDFKYANDLVKFIKLKSDLSIGVAGYPEGHIEAKSIEDDVKHLKVKVDSGADTIFTQLFFDNDKFYKYCELLNNMQIHLPIIPGIMPIISKKQIERMTSLAKISVPQIVKTAIEKYGNNSGDMQKFGIEFASKQCENLIKFGVRGLHFYTLNKSKSTNEILNNIL